MKVKVIIAALLLAGAGMSANAQSTDDISLCCHYVSETAIKGRSFLALYSSGSDRNLLSGYSNGRIS